MNADKIPVLLVDDNPVDAALAQQMLEVLGKDLPVATTWVDNAAKALAELQRAPYELVLLDYQMPDATGLEVLSRISRLPPDRPPAVIMLTATGSEEIAVQAMKSGAKDYLRKDTLDIAPLTRALTSALAQKRLQDQLDRSNAQMDEELRMARELQAALLPQRYPSFPPDAGPGKSRLRFCQRYVPATTLGGDFFDVFAVSDSAAGVVICDVMGHGVRAALVTAMLRTLVEELRPSAADPGRFLAGINHGLVGILQQTGTTMFATAFYAVADIGRGELRFANAGHPSPLRLRRGPGMVESLNGTPGPALGLFGDSAYSTNRCGLDAGDLVVLFTDGLFEVQNEHGKEYGPAGILEFCRPRVQLPPEPLFTDLLDDIQRFSGVHGFEDDVCLVGVEAVNDA